MIDAAADSSNFFIGKNLEGEKGKIDLSGIKDLYDDDQILEEMKQEGNILLERNDVEEEEDVDENGKRKKKPKTKSQKEIKRIEEESFAKEYQKAGGIQHIICSATLTIDKQGRITPRQAKADKKRKIKQKADSVSKGKKMKKHLVEEDQNLNTIEELCKVLKFRSKNPKIIDLTEEERMPDTLTEKAIRCAIEEKDLYLYYYLQRKAGQSHIIFTNSITCAKRVASVLDFLKVKNHALHSKMQQKQRFKSFDRFKAAVQKIESAPVELGSKPEEDKKMNMIDDNSEGAILVCTDVAARGLDIPNV